MRRIKTKERFDYRRLVLADRLMNFLLDKKIDNILILKVIFKIYFWLTRNAYVLNHKSANHHYIPQFLLKKFKIPNTGQIYEYNRLAQVKPISIAKEAACALNLYSFRDKETKQQSDFIENQIFASTLEKYASRIINKILEEDIINLTILERSILTSYISFQFVRTPYFFWRIKTIIEYLNLEKSITIEEMKERDFFKKCFFENYYRIDPIEFFKFTGENNNHLVEAEDLILTLAISIGDYLSSILAKYELRMLEAKEPAFFYLSDSPASMYDVDELRSIGIFLWFLGDSSLISLPISPNRCLYYIKSNKNIPVHIIGGMIGESIQRNILEFIYSDRKLDEIKSNF